MEHDFEKNGLKPALKYKTFNLNISRSYWDFLDTIWLLAKKEATETFSFNQLTPVNTWLSLDALALAS